MIRIQNISVIRNKSLYVNDEKLFHTEVPMEVWGEHAYQYLGISYPKFFKMDKLSQLGFIAAHALFERNPLQGLKDEVALIFSNAHSSVDADMRYAKSIEQNPSPGLFVYTLPNIVMGEISIKFGFKGEQSFFITPQFDPEFLVEYTTMVLSQSNVTACLVAWVDVCEEHHDVFLYLIQKGDRGKFDHTPKMLKTLYSDKIYGRVSGRS